MKPKSEIIKAHSLSPEVCEAARTFHAAVCRRNLALAVFFCSYEYDIPGIERELSRLFEGIPVVGCTSSGEIGPMGCTKKSISGLGFPKDGFVAVEEALDNLDGVTDAEASAFAMRVLAGLRERDPDVRQDTTFGILLIDGLSGKEERITRAFQRGLGDITLVGGSASDNLRLEHTPVYRDGDFRENRAILALVKSSVEFRAFKTQHFLGGQERLVVTEADAERRIVREINGRPATDEYARLIGVAPERLSSGMFAASPFVARIGGTDYIRAIRTANPDKSLTLFCTIDRGVVLRIGRANNLEQNRRLALSEIEAELGTPQAVIGFECGLCDLESERTGQKSAIQDLYERFNVVGFYTYGEQFMGFHVNQTFTGLAFKADGLR
jgi:hypothetical protein